jgi:hypothetical protein
MNRALFTLILLALGILLSRAASTPPRPPGAQAGLKSSAVKSSPAPPLWLVWHTNTTGTLLWDRNPEPNVTGYRVYSGRSSRVYDTAMDVGNATFASVPFIIGPNFFAVTAYDSGGLESAFSLEVTYVQPSPPPLRAALVRVAPATAPVGVFVVETKASLGQPWAQAARVTNAFYAVPAAALGFFRVKGN